MAPSIAAIQRWVESFRKADEADAEPRYQVQVPDGFGPAPDGVLPLHLPSGERGEVTVRDGYIEAASLVIDDRPIHHTEAREFSLLTPVLDCLRPATDGHGVVRRVTSEPGSVTCPDCIAIRMARRQKVTAKAAVAARKPVKKVPAGARA
jgi:hypothetical protein